MEVFCFCCSDCTSCQVGALQMGWIICIIWAAIKKYNLAWQCGMNLMKWSTSCLLKQQVQFSGSLVFCEYVVEILKIDTSPFTNKWIQILWIRSCACCGYAFSLWRDICLFYNQEDGHWNHPCGFSLDRHIYLAANHCYTQLKLDGWLRLGIKHYLFLEPVPACWYIGKPFLGGVENLFQQ